MPKENDSKKHSPQLLAFLDSKFTNRRMGEVMPETLKNIV